MAPTPGFMRDAWNVPEAELPIRQGRAAAPPTARVAPLGPFYLSHFRRAMERWWRSIRHFRETVTTGQTGRVENRPNKPS